MNDNSKLAVAALQNGTVIDHIPSHLVFKVVRLLDLENVEGSVTIGYNLDSKKLGKKGILKVSGVTFPEETLNRLALSPDSGPESHQVLSVIIIQAGIHYFPAQEKS